MTSTNDYEFKVDLPCEGCVNAVKRSLNKSYGAELAAVDANLDTKHVKITITRSGEPYTYDQVFEALSKAGKTVTKLQ